MGMSRFWTELALGNCVLGVAKYPTRLDLVMFGLFCMATQSSYALYNAVTKDPRFAGLVRLGVSSFKSSKHIQVSGWADEWKTGKDCVIMLE